MCVYLYVYLYIINIHRAYTYIMQTKTFILDVINCLTALIKIFFKDHVTLKTEVKAAETFSFTSTNCILLYAIV